MRDTKLLKVRNRIFGTVISILTLINLLIDLFVTKEYHTEDNLFPWIFLLMLLNLMRINHSKVRKSLLIKVIVNFSLLGINFATTFLLYLLWFGLGYGGANPSLNFYLGCALNVVFYLYLIFDIGEFENNEN